MIKKILALVLGGVHLINVYLIKLLKPIFISKNIKPANEILVVHLSVALGDEIWMMGFVKHLQTLKPDEPITLVISPKFKGFIEANTNNVNVLTYPYVGDKNIRLIFRLYSVLKFARSIGKQFKTTITPRVEDEQHASFICYALSNGQRFGFDQNSTPNRVKYCRGVNQLFTVNAKPKSMGHHSLENVQQILKAIDPNAKLLSQSWLGERKPRQNLENTTRKTIVLSTSSGHSLLKKWPVRSYGELILSLQAQSTYDIHFVIIGDSADISDSLEIMTNVEPKVSIESRVAKQTLQEVLGLLSQADIYIGADTGLLHMANACGVATIGIFGSSCIHQFSPYLKANSTVITKNLQCSPCNTGHLIDRCSKCIYSEPRCMTELSHLVVANVAISYLQNSNTIPSVVYAD